MRRQSDIGWTELIIGIIMIIFGLFIVRQPVGIITWIVIVCGSSCDTHRNCRYHSVCQNGTLFTGFGPILSLITGILSVMAGFMLIVHPGAGTWAIVMILPIWIIAHCVSRLSHLQYMKMHFGTTYYYISMILNILD